MLLPECQFISPRRMTAVFILVGLGAVVLLVLPVCSFPEFQAWILCTSLISHIRATSLAHITFLDLSLITLMMSHGVQITKLLIM